MDGAHRASSTERNNYSTITPSNSQEHPKEISTVVIACHQWLVLFCHIITNLFKPGSSRARKIRCDSTRPVCNNCLRRSNECHYDTVPKRRGPDKRPGTRQRSCKKRPSDGSAPLPPPKRKRPARPDESPTVRIKPAMESTYRSPSRHTDDLATPQINSLQRVVPIVRDHLGFLLF